MMHPSVSDLRHHLLEISEEKGLARSQPYLLCCNPYEEGNHQNNQNGNPQRSQNPTPVDDADELQHDEHNSTSQMPRLAEDFLSISTPYCQCRRGRCCPASQLLQKTEWVGAP